MILAAATGRPDLIELLAGFGADIGLPSGFNSSPVPFEFARKYTPLHLAMLHNHVDAVRILLELGADSSQPIGDALTLALSNGNLDPEITGILSAAGIETGTKEDAPYLENRVNRWSPEEGRPPFEISDSEEVARLNWPKLGSLLNASFYRDASNDDSIHVNLYFRAKSPAPDLELHDRVICYELIGHEWKCREPERRASSRVAGQEEAIRINHYQRVQVHLNRLIQTVRKIILAHPVYGKYDQPIKIKRINLTGPVGEFNPRQNIFYIYLSTSSKQILVIQLKFWNLDQSQLTLLALQAVVHH